MKDALLSSRTLIFTRTQISPHRGSHMWVNLEPTPSRIFSMPRSVFSPISLAGYFSKLTGIRRGLLATSGYQTKPSFSKVRQHFLFLSLFLMAFLDVCGKLEGESIVQKSIRGASNLWYREEPPLSPPASPNNPSPTVTASPTNSESNGSFQDWREPICGVICRGMISLETDICIRAASQQLQPQLSFSGFHNNIPRFQAYSGRSPVSRSPRTPAPPYPSALSVARPQQPPMTAVAAVPLTNQATPPSTASKVIENVRHEGLLSPPTVTSPSAAMTGPHRPHTTTRELKGCGKSSGKALGKADNCSSANKGTTIADARHAIISVCGMAVLEPKMQSGFLNVAMDTLALPVLLPSDLPVTGTLLTLAPFLLLYTVYRFVYYVRSTVVTSWRRNANLTANWLLFKMVKLVKQLARITVVKAVSNRSTVSGT